jgi:arginyl-tRNA synthetase
MAADPLSDLRAAVGAAVASTGAESGQEPAMERPKRAEQGDYSTNAAMILAPGLGEKPRDIAERLAGDLKTRLGAGLDRLEVAGPGFVNLFLSDSWHRSGVASVLEAKRFGKSPSTTPAVLLEFVSANPTGPLTAAGGRGAAYGDSLARVLEMAGHEVSREYYLNDAGTQIRTFGASISARMAGADPPADGYSGEYVAELGEELRAADADPDNVDELSRLGAERMRGRIEETLRRFRVIFDTWSSERALHESNALERTLEDLAERGHTYVSDGALWLRTSAWDDDKDRVLIRSDGEPTYFAADIAYHRDKLERGAEQMIVPLGADHHGYVPRMKAAVGMLSGDPGRYEAPIMQLVNIIEGGERARMSKRKGDFVTLDELMDDIGVDAARFFLLQRSHDTVIDLDLELARSQSQENPVFYVQYAHARIAGIIAKAVAEGSATDESAISSGLSDERVALAACEPSERALIRRMLELPDEVREAAKKRAPHRISAYATAVAADFHAFYRDCRVVGADAESGVEGLEAARLGVCLATKRVIAQCLDLLGIDAPERM